MGDEAAKLPTGDRYVLRVDGGFRRGVGSFGWTLRRDKLHYRSGHGIIREAQSSDEMEYRAIIVGLEVVRQERHAGKLVVLTDSRGVVRGLCSRFGTRSIFLKPLCNKARAMIEKFRSGGWTVAVSWIPRQKNGRADALSKVALDTYREGER